jgi:hypothetical protein
LKSKSPSSTHKKVVVELHDRKVHRGYLNPSRLVGSSALDLLTPEGAHLELSLDKVRAVYFVADLEDDFAPERKSFLSRPKLDGLWIKLRFRDGETLEGVVPNDLLNLLDNGIHIRPPDLNSNADRIFIPRPSVSEVTVLGVVGIARRKPATSTSPTQQPTLFTE